MITSENKQPQRKPLQQNLVHPYRSFTPTMMQFTRRNRSCNLFRNLASAPTPSSLSRSAQECPRLRKLPSRPEERGESSIREWTTSRICADARWYQFSQSSRITKKSGASRDKRLPPFLEK